MLFFLKKIIIIQIKSGSRDLVIQDLDGYFDIFCETRCAVLLNFCELFNIGVKLFLLLILIFQGTY